MYNLRVLELEIYGPKNGNRALAYGTRIDNFLKITEKFENLSKFRFKGSF